MMLSITDIIRIALQTQSTNPGFPSEPRPRGVDIDRLHNVAPMTLRETVKPIVEEPVDWVKEGF